MKPILVKMHVHKTGKKYTTMLKAVISGERD